MVGIKAALDQVVIFKEQFAAYDVAEELLFGNIGIAFAGIHAALI